MYEKSFRYFTAIAEEQSLSAAARRLGLSQPTLSSYLSDLESQVGMDLFLREKKKMLLTPAGKIYLDASRRILKVHDQTLHSILSLSQEMTETIIVGVTPYRGAILASEIFPLFARRYPHVRLEFREDYMLNLHTLTRKGEINLSVATHPDTEPDDFDQILNAREEVVIGVPAFHRLAHLASRTSDHLVSMDIQEFFDTPYIQMTHGNTIRTISDSIFASAGYQPTVVFTTSNNLVVNTLIRQGLGFGMVPRSLITQDDEHIVYFSMKPRYYLNLCVLTQKGRKLTEAERYFAYLIIKKEQDNPFYKPASNAYSQAIRNEFDKKEHSL